MSKKVSWNDFKTMILEMHFNGYLAGALTDEYVFTAVTDSIPKHYSPDTMENKVLELRFFNKDMEIKLFRTSIANDLFYLRIREDKKDENKSGKFMDEIQFLDIDTKKSVDEQGMVYAIGGGRYFMPEEFRSRIDGLAVQVRSYFGRYEDSGQVRIIDWRLVDIVDGESIKKKEYEQWQNL